jgi:FeS assembly protein IscX
MHWLDVEDIAEALHDAHASLDPLRIRFTELRRLVEALPGFEADPDHPVNEKILEVIQAEWYRLRTGTPRDDD